MKNYVKKADVLYYMGVFFAVFSASVTSTSYLFRGTGLNTIVRYMALIFFLGAIFMRNRWKKKSIVIIAAIILLSVLVVITSNDKPLILYVLMVITIGDINPLEVVKKVAVLNLIFLILVVGSSLIGIIPNEMILHNGSAAYCLGYYYYSSCAFQVFFLTVIGYLLISGKLRKIYETLYIVVSVLTNFIIYKVCTVRLTFYIFILFLVLVWLFKYMHFFSNNRFYRIIATCMFPGASLITIFLSWNYKQISFMSVLDTILNARFSFNYKAFQQYPISILGNYIETHAEEWDLNWHNLYFYIDSGYIDILLSDGIIIFLLAIVGYTLIIRMAVRENNYKLFTWCVIVCVFSVVNNVFLSVCINPLLIFCIKAIDSEKNERKNVLFFRPTKI